MHTNIISGNTPSFKAKLKDTPHLEKLTKNEIAHGRYSAYKDALQTLNAAHKGEVLDLRQLSDGKTYKVINEKTGASGTIDYTGNLTNTVYELARPTSKIHKEVFGNSDCSLETEAIRTEFYA